MRRAAAKFARRGIWLCSALLSVGCASTPASYVMLIESPDGSTGKVIVTDAQGGSRVLELARQVAVLDGSARAAPEISGEQARADFAGAMAAQPPLPETVALRFESGAVRLMPASLVAFKEFARRVRARPAPELLIVGHTDTVGEQRSNERLGLARARVVAAMLGAEGVDPLSLTIETRGERDPEVPTPDEVPEPRNRRAVLLVR